MIKRALLIGLNNYEKHPLHGCVNDATELGQVLAQNDDNSPNFGCRYLVSQNNNTIPKGTVKAEISNLFKDEADICLLFFAGHGMLTETGGILVTEDASSFDEGLLMSEVLSLANRSKAKEVVVILDCCHSGSFGNTTEIPGASDTSTLRKGVAILTACNPEQTSVETRSGGIFTSLIIDALKGGASDVLGKVSIASAYSYVDEVLGAWDQRPLFKLHASRLIPLRECTPQIAKDTLRKLPKYFQQPDSEYQLNPSYEPTSNFQPNNPENERIFQELQKMRAVRLVEPVGEEHMYYAAMHSKACRLTPLGKFYRTLAAEGRF